MNRRRSARRNAKPKKSWVQKCKDCLRQFIAFLFSNVGIICLVVGYTAMGAVMFQELEADLDVEQKFMVQLNKTYDDILECLWITSSTARSFNDSEYRSQVEAELIKLQNYIVAEVKDKDFDGINIYSGRWSIYAAVLYCLTVITTIGYGNIAPRSNIGKVVTIVYAIFGMPLFLLYLSNIGDLLAKSFKWLYAKFCLCKICRLKRKRTLNSATPTPPASVSNSWRNASEKSLQQNITNPTDAEDSDDEDTEMSGSSSTVSTKDPQDVVVPISLCLTIMIGYISVGALLFAGQENWDFLEGSYFCFISLSTIGFGDIVPSTTESNGDNKFQLNFIFCSIYLMLGMALIAMCFNLMQQDVVQKIRTCTDIVRRIARCRR